MRVRMFSGMDTVEWSLLNSAGSISVKQVDRNGIYRVPFTSTDLAGAWILSQINFFRTELGYQFTI